MDHIYTSSLVTRDFARSSASFGLVLDTRASKKLASPEGHAPTKKKEPHVDLDTGDNEKGDKKSPGHQDSRR